MIERSNFCQSLVNGVSSELNKMNIRFVSTEEIIFDAKGGSQTSEIISALGSSIVGIASIEVLV